MFEHKFRLAAAAAFACVAVATPATASAATEPALTSRVISVKQFPGWQVVEKPTVSPRDTKTSACETPDPVGSTTVSTTLLATTKLSATRARSTTISETVIETPSAAAARSLYLKTRALAVTCGLDASTTRAKVGFRVGRGTVVPGASHAFTVIITVPRTTTKVQGKTVTSSGTGRVAMYLSGRYLIAITPSRFSTSIQGSRISVVATDDAYTQALTTKAATAAIALLG